ncbi:MAG TPA: diaminopimelate decarboxylase, partial [Oscillospiraceae bacterium]|nr:diaminopimelate decarboxylase [Oscillospiraceae bacterium]
MYELNDFDINEKGHLTIGGCDSVEIAKHYGTPAYVYDENMIRSACRAFTSSMKEHYDGKGMVLYASKAFSCKEIYRLVKEEGMGIDVVSDGELYTALSAGFPAEKIYFHGNNKTLKELEMAVRENVGRIVGDNFEELKNLSKVAKAAGKKVKILLRIKPGIDAGKHEFIKTGQIDSKFGFALETGEAMEAAEQALAIEELELVGVHCHIGSQIVDVTPFEYAAKVMLNFIADLKEKTGFEAGEMNLGGGFGIKYLKSDTSRPFEDYMESVSKVVKEETARLGLKMPFVLIEPGRSIVGAAGITLYTVGSVKKIPGVRTYVAVDGGMGDSPRYSLYGALYEVVCANKASVDRDHTATIAGRNCESGDLIQENAKIQRVEAGDTLAVLATGAYNYSMASNYNRICRPPVIFTKDGQHRLVVRRESYEDLVRN